MTNNDSVKKVLLVTFLLCFICSILVSMTAVLLKERQQANEKLDIEKSILEVSGLVKNAKNLTRDQVFELTKKSIVPLLVDIPHGKIYKGSDFDVNMFDALELVKDSNLSRPLSLKEDIALIKREENFARIFMVNDAHGALQVIILPVRGYGLWSTLYGFLALKKDFKTVQGLTFYSQQETPGLGGEVDNPRWKAQWHGKQVFDDHYTVDIHVVKGGISKDKARALHEVDAISGATLTSRGVENLINFWLGPKGFGPFLKNLKNGKA